MELICSIGPNIKEFNDVKAFINAGMTIPRFNFSHIDYEMFEELVKKIREEYPDMKILQDLQGNKLRISKLYTYENKVIEGEQVLFCMENQYKNLMNIFREKRIKIIPISYSGVLEDFKNVNEIYMKDATMNFKVLKKNESFILAITKRGGILRAEKGVNAPGLLRGNLILTPKDRNDIEIGLKNKVDIICASYVTSANDIKEIKNYIKKLKKQHKYEHTPKIWAKIECKEAIENFDEILKCSDGIMIGRGDLKAEIDIEELPIQQEKIITKMKRSSKPLVIATHLLESLKKEDKPTVSEITVIYNLIINKVNGLMLCTEVSISKDPIKIIKWLNSLYKRYGDQIE